MHHPETINVERDERMIPIWSIVLAAIAFVGVEYYFWLVAPAQRHHAPPAIGLRVYFNLSWGVMSALYFLMVGYISKDAPRRGMSTRFWMVVCFVIPAGIGAVLYFLLRAPEVAICPACGTHVLGDFHFCPQCCYQLTASCGHCFRTVRTTDQFCTRCGHELSADQRPARLHMLGS
ncbi:MAG: zinc ribbon domain-containing protein [Terracidiphilus sp.]|nr:zinc ribbon domain-containing protein [Terracidiphilus sp.]